MNENDSRVVYHIAIKNNFILSCKNNSYKPIDFDSDGFIHCTGEPETTLLVLEDYFQQVTEEILIIQIEVNKLTSTIKFENPAPIVGGGTSHIKTGLLFPHIYGALNLNAINGAAIIKKKSELFVWPDKFIPIENFLRKD
jgi:uncharacterized protein (DUF952 family)